MKTLNLLYIVLLPLIVLSFSCKTQKESSKNKDFVADVPGVNKEDVIASIEREPCFGQCPVFKLEVKADGTVFYEGKANVDKIGKFKGKATQKQVLELLTEAKRINFYDFKDEYDNKYVTDLPSTFITINYTGTPKKIKSRYQEPEELVNFMKFFENKFSTIEYVKIEE